jgi:hypothetical protein
MGSVERKESKMRNERHGEHGPLMTKLNGPMRGAFFVLN